MLMRLVGGCVVLLMASTALAPAALAPPGPNLWAYPTPTDFNAASVLDQGSWTLFTSIDGLGHEPNASGGESGVVLLWNVVNGSYVVTIDQTGVPYYRPEGTSYELPAVTVTGARLDVEGNTEFNVTLSRTIFGSQYGDLADYDVTALVDATGTVHVLWERSQEVFDAPSYYWLFHEIVDGDGNVIESGLLFYFEKAGGYCCEPPRDYTLLLCGIVFFGIPVAVVCLAFLRAWRRSRKQRRQ